MALIGLYLSRSTRNHMKTNPSARLPSNQWEMQDIDLIWLWLIWFHTNTFLLHISQKIGLIIYNGLWQTARVDWTRFGGFNFRAVFSMIMSVVVCLSWCCFLDGIINCKSSANFQNHRHWINASTCNAIGYEMYAQANWIDAICMLLKLWWMSNENYDLNFLFLGDSTLLYALSTDCLCFLWLKEVVGLLDCRLTNWRKTKSGD